MATSHLLDEPHHDGSVLYLADDTPRLGDHVAVRVRTSTRAAVDRIEIRTVEDAEPFFVPMTRAETEGDSQWWAGTVHVRNPVQRYRFMVISGDSFVWLNQAGVFDHDVSDVFDFVVSTYPAAPAWGRDGFVYQIFPDRFARSAEAADRPTPEWAKPASWDDVPLGSGPDVSIQFYGGDLDGITEHLDHIAELGADTVYLTPVFPAESNHRYNASTFDEVDPLLGGDDAYRRLIDAVHERGWRMLGDLTANHTGDTHEWFVSALAGGPERDFYYFAPDGSYEGWKGYQTLPKLDHRNEELGERFRNVVTHWLDFGLDGWRIDVANMTGRHVATDLAHDVAREIRRAAETVHPDALVLAEHGHDAGGDLDGDGWHGTMNYYGFSFPVWEFVRKPSGFVPSFGWPVGVPRRTALQSFTAMREFTARFGWRSVNASWNILGSHDSPRIRTTTGSAGRHHAAIALQFTLPGVPMVFAGDELGAVGNNGEESRTTFDWDHEAEWDKATMSVYRQFADLRRENDAFRHGSLRWVHLGENVVAYLREHPSGTFLVAVSRGDSPAVELPLSGVAVVGSDALAGAIPSYDEPAVGVWRITPA